ncbi:MAG: arsenite methyltransferase [Chloroflexota bacterium]|nr:arsenite methyltransferase [Chloroflexota bacterium]
MATEQEIKEFVKQRYGEVARQASEQAATSCCGADAGPKDAISDRIYTPEELGEVPLEAALASAGCGNPVFLAELHPGEVVLDLGSGGGIDVLLSARRVGPTGKAYGLDMTDEMLELARQNQAKAGIENVEFLKGEMEDIPLPDNSVDVIISNCVVNLSPNKDAVLSEAYRVLKPGGRVAISDIVTVGELPEAVRQNLNAWASCLAGALEQKEYVGKLTAAGFQDAAVEVYRSFTAEGPKEGGDPDPTPGSGYVASAYIRAQKPVPSTSGRCC